MTLRFVLSLLVTCLVVLPTTAAAKKDWPQTSNDGLELVKDTDVAAVYIKPGASLEPYDKVMLVDAFVAFEKDWQRDYNRDHMGSQRVTDSDMQEIKEEVASEFKQVFTEELQKGGYEVVTEVGQDVLLVRPAIVDLQINAPDVSSAEIRDVFVTSAGSMVLYTELYDSVTSQKFAEIFDGQEVGDRSFGYRANRVTNRAALQRGLRHWAGLLVKSLDEAHGKND